MLEGWHDDAYVVLFEEASVASRYDVSTHLPGYAVVGLMGWDDFIVRGPEGQLSTIPTLPIDARYLVPLAAPIDPQRIEPDARFQGKVKWYVKPLVFGGDPRDQANMAWVTFEQHVQLVNWWNQRYRELK